MPPRVKASDWLTEEALIKIEGWARDGLTTDQIAMKMGCHPATLYRWQNLHNEIYEALKRGKEVVDRQVEQSLLKSALGHEYEEVKTYIEETAGGKKKRIEKTKKYIPPNSTAQIFWLKNRKPDEWREKQNIEYNGNVNSKIDLSTLSQDDLVKLANMSDHDDKDN